jgi:hypothetical protein
MKTISVILFLLVTAQAQAWVEIISCVVDSPQPTAQVEQVKSTTPEQASVRVVVDHGLLKSRFSGTAIAPNLVVTCWHGFRDKGSVSVNGKPAKLLRKDEISDVALIEIEPELAKKEPFNFLPIAKEPAKKGEQATAYGYEYNRSGLWKFPTTITAVNRYNNFANYSIAGRPNKGRSGGGLFNANNELIGVCSASDGDEGLYCGLEAIKNLLSEAKHEVAYFRWVDGYGWWPGPEMYDPKQPKQMYPPWPSVPPSYGQGKHGMTHCAVEAKPQVQAIVNSDPPAKTLTPAMPLKNAGVDFNPTIRESLTVQSDCPDGRCPLQRKQPTLAPQAIEPVQPRPVLRSVMQPVQRVAQAKPVRRMAGRLFSGRLFSRLRCR